MGRKINLLDSQWHMKKTWVYFLLGVSILSEQMGTACLQASHGYTILKFTILTAVLYTITYFVFSKILEQIDLAVAYATWSAVGGIGAALMSVFLFRQELSVIGWLSVIGMSIGVVLLNVFGTPKEEEGER